MEKLADVARHDGDESPDKRDEGNDPENEEEGGRGSIFLCGDGAEPWKEDQGL
jgi:hypothetical protein